MSDNPEDLMSNLDLDLTDISGEISQTPPLTSEGIHLESPEVAAAIAVIEKELTPEQLEEKEWQEVVNRLSAACEKNQQWIILKTGDGGYRLEDAMTCEPQEFYDWIVQTYPPAGDPERYKHKPEDYQDLKLREKAIVRVCNLAQDQKWPKGSMNIRSN
jgi:hypothetical protein